jgi:hypothetical protein
LLLAKKNAWVVFKIYTKNGGKGFTEFYKYVWRCKGNREDIIAMKDVNWWLITDWIAKANSLNFHYSSVFSCERSISQIGYANSYEPFAISKSLGEG